MVPFPIFTPESAPDGAREALRGLQAQVGFVPNLAGAMAGSPALLKGFLAVRQEYEGGSFSAAEIQALSLTAAFENGCAWCMGFHTFMALHAGIAPDDVEALRDGRAPGDPRLRALCDLARSMIRQRGAVSDDEMERFLAAGYTRTQALDVVLGMAFSLMASYAGHLVDPPLDAPFAPHAWHQPVAAASSPR